MLKRFSVTNFKNFREKATMHFDEAKDYGFNCSSLIKVDEKGGKLINKALLYGDNGSGKSNLGFAIMELNNHLTDKMKNPSHYANFLNADSDSEWADFEYAFADGTGEEIVYRYSKDAFLRLGEEKVFYQGELIYGYDYRKGELIKPLKEAPSLDFSNLRGDVSGVKYIKNTIPLPEDHPIRFIVDFAEGMLWFRSLRGNEYMGVDNEIRNLSSFLGDPSIIGGFNAFLKDCGLDYELISLPGAMPKSPSIGVKFRKRTLDFFSIASAGTASLALLYYWLEKSKGSIRFLFIDEFDAFYHHDLAEGILKLINSKAEFQSLLTTHNTYLMSNSFMRPDAYFQLRGNQIASLSDSTDKVIREGNNLERMYRANEFGR